MKELSTLKMLAEKAGGNEDKIMKFVRDLDDLAEDAYEAISKLREKMQSQVLTDTLKAEGFPATESKAAKEAVNAAFEAVKKANNEVADLYMALGMHFDPPTDE